MPDDINTFNNDVDERVINKTAESSVTRANIGDLLKRAANMLNELNALFADDDIEVTSVQVDGNTSVPQFRYKVYLTGMRLQNLDEVVLMGNGQDIINFKRAGTVTGKLRSDMIFGFTPGNTNQTIDVGFSRESSGVLALGNGAFGNRSAKLKLGAINISYYTPSGTADAAGEVGDLCLDDNYLYKKTNSGWLRIGGFSTF